MKEVLSFGAGVQSTTLLVMSCLGKLPKLDHVIFADTQWEPAAVYDHLEWCKDFAARHGITIDVRTAGNLRQDLIEFWGQRKSADGKRHASIPAFVKNPGESAVKELPLLNESEVVWLDGGRGLVRRQCTGTYKIDVIEKYVRQDVLALKHRQRWPLDPVVRQWIGISRDEMGRMKRSVRPAIVFWHPLIESEALSRRRPGQMFPDGLSRRDCLNWLASVGINQPPRSACIGCPFRRNREWRMLTPDEMANAVEVDRLIRSGNRERKANDLIGDPYLHESLVPLSEVDFGADDDERNGFGAECDGVCGV